MPSSPTAVVKSIDDITEDPENANNILVTWSYLILFCGSEGPMEQMATISIANTSTKTQVKSAINSAMITAFTQLPTGSFSLSMNRIWTVADIAG